MNPNPNTNLNDNLAEALDIVEVTPVAKSEIIVDETEDKQNLESKTPKFRIPRLALLAIFLLVAIASSVNKGFKKNMENTFRTGDYKYREAKNFKNAIGKENNREEQKYEKCFKMSVFYSKNVFLAANQVPGEDYERANILVSADKLKTNGIYTTCIDLSKNSRNIKNAIENQYNTNSESANKSYGVSKEEILKKSDYDFDIFYRSAIPGVKDRCKVKTNLDELKFLELEFARDNLDNTYIECIQDTGNVNTRTNYFLYSKDKSRSIGVVLLDIKDESKEFIIGR
jgi:hypothetical protein